MTSWGSTRGSISAAVSAGGLAVLLDGEVLLVGIALGGRAHRAGVGAAEGGAAAGLDRAGGLDGVGGKAGIAGGALEGLGGRDRGSAEDEGGGDGGDTGLRHG